jgi:hypothetical protein
MAMSLASTAETTMGIVEPVASAGTSPNDAGIRLDGLSKSFRSPDGPVHAVRDIDVAIERGRDRRAARAEWCRQVDDDRHAARPAAA